MEPEDARLAGAAAAEGDAGSGPSPATPTTSTISSARVVLPNGSRLRVAVFTKGVKTVPGVIPSVYERVAARFARRRGLDAG